jgi:hypothetical protein
VHTGRDASSAPDRELAHIPVAVLARRDKSVGIVPGE